MRPARNWQVPFLLLLVTAACWLASPLAGTIAVMVLAAMYLGSIGRYPWRPCWNCEGSGGRTDRLWGGARGRCLACQGAKQQLRWGVRVLTPDRARRLRAGELGRFG